MSEVTLKKVITETLKEIYPLLHSEWTDSEYRDLGIAALKSAIANDELDLNDHLEEIVGRYVDHDVSKKAKVHFASGRQFVIADFTEKQAEEQIIKIGDGRRVKVVDAGFQHILKHHVNQAREAQGILNSQEITNQVMESPVGKLLYENPNWNFRDGMRHLGYWK